MKLLWKISTWMLAWIPIVGTSQPTEQYDIIRYTPPKGWKLESTDAAVSFATTNNKTKEWCQLIVYKSIRSSGNPASDFDREWEELVTRSYEGTTKPSPEISREAGWTVYSGVSQFLWQAQTCTVLLNTISGYGRAVSIAVTMRGSSYMNVIEQFLNSVELENSAQDTPQITTVQSNPDESGTGITKSTTHFTDGWTAVAYADHVEVTIENTIYRSYYGVPSHNVGGEQGTTKYYWDKHIVPLYTITNLWLNPDIQSIGYHNYYAEGTGIEKSTGRNVFIGMRVVVESGVDFFTMAAATTKEEYVKHFPNMNDLKAMRNSNRFAVTYEDIVGNWSSTSSSTLQYYNVYTGQSAGMQFSQGGQEFDFKNSGDYNARISGAMGTMGGSQVVFDNKYQGKFSVADWEITMTGYGGITQIFTAYFEALQSGRVLHIAKKDAPGVHYPLIKVK